MQSTSVFGGIFKVLDWFTRFSLANLLWVLFNLPISFLLLTIAITDDRGFILSTWILVAILTPFLFFPATTALYGVVRQWVLNENDISIIPTFWKNYRENYLKSMAGGLILTPIWVIGVVDTFFFIKKSFALSVVLVIILWFLFILTTYFFAVIVHHDIKLLKGLKQAFLFIIINPINSLFIGLINIVILYMCIMKFTFLIPFLMGSAIAFLAFTSYYGKYIKVKKVQDS